MNMKKLLLTAMLLASGSSFAGSANTNVNVLADVQANCVFEQPNFVASFGNIPGYSVGYANTNVAFYCSAGLPYTLTMDQAQTSETTELITIKAYLDSTHTNELTNGGSVAGVGVDMTQQILTPLYLKATGEGTDNGQGREVYKSGSFTGILPVYLNF